MLQEKTKSSKEYEKKDWMHQWDDQAKVDFIKLEREVDMSQER